MQEVEIDVHHFRRVKGRLDPMHISNIRNNRLQDKIQARGGMTVVDVWTKNGDYLASATADCSEHDNYNKAIGRLLATERALKKLKEVHDA